MDDVPYTSDEAHVSQIVASYIEVNIDVGDLAIISVIASR